MKLQVIFGFLLIASSSANFEHAKSLSINNRIMGGVEAPFGMFPFMVPLYVEFLSSEGYTFGGFCGSTLISEEFILTAAHCVYAKNIVKLKLLIGAKTNKEEPEEGRIDIIVPKENIIVHERYGKVVRYHDDIALVRLPQKVSFTYNIQPARLPRRSQPPIESDVAVILGWGYRGENAPESDLLHYAQLRILPTENCKNHFGAFFNPESQMCIDGQGKSACSGDSGGAAVIVDREDRRFTQVGVASYVSGHGCEKGYPFSYTRVSAYLDWIHQHTGIPIQD